MSSPPFLAGGGAIRSPSPRSSQFSSTSFSPPPISTISDSNGSSSSSFAIITKKPRSPRKRINQSYNEAVELLSFVFPNVFPLRAPPLHRRRTPSTFPEAPPAVELLLISPFPSFVVTGDASLFLPPELPPPPPENPTRRQLSNSVHNSYQSSSSPSSRFITEPFATTASSPAGFFVVDDNGGDIFNPESMLEEGDAVDIDGIMGELAASRSCINGGTGGGYVEKTSVGFGAELRRRALRRSEDDDYDWWRKPTLAVPKLESSSPEMTTMKMKEKKDQSKPSSPAIGTEEKPFLGLKLNYEEVLREWAGRGSPFAGDILAKLSEMELSPESGGGGREASVKRYRDKRSRRVSSGKIRYQVRKVSADKRPRVKGRFVKAEEAAVAAAAAPPPRRG